MDLGQTIIQVNQFCIFLKKTRFMMFSVKNAEINLQDLHLNIGGKIVEHVGSNSNEKYFKFVGHVLDERMT